MKDENIAQSAHPVGRRDLMGVGAGAVVTAMQFQSALAQDQPARPVPTWRAVLGQRAGRQAPRVSWFHVYCTRFPINLNDRLVSTFDNTMLDSIAALLLDSITRANLPPDGAIDPERSKEHLFMA
jgi:hypothetical protein